MIIISIFKHSHGGWVVDGFPFLRDHWPFMEDAKVIPDFVVYFDSNATTDGGVEGSRLLMKRYCDMEGITDPYQEKETPSGEETESSTTDKKVRERWRMVYIVYWFIIGAQILLKIRYFSLCFTLFLIELHMYMKFVFTCKYYITYMYTVHVYNLDQSS